MKCPPTITLTAVVLAAFALSGCENKQSDKQVDTQREALRFNEDVSAASKRIGKSVEEFFDSVGAAFASGDAGDIATMDANYDGLLKAIYLAQGEASALKAPPGRNAQNLFEAHEKYLGLAEKLCKTDLKELAKSARDTRTPARERRGRIEAILHRVKAAHDEEVAKVQASQEEFAQEYHINLK